MNQANQTKARILPMRRLALLATTVAGLAVGGILVAPTLSPYAPMAHGAESVAGGAAASRGRPALPTSSRR